MRAAFRGVLVPFGALALALAAAFAAVGAVLGGFAAERLVGGFTFDWYVHQPSAPFAPEAVAAKVALVAAVGALVAAVAGWLSANVLWDALVGRGRVAQTRRPGAVSRSVAAVPVVLLALAPAAAAFALLAEGPALAAADLDALLRLAGVAAPVLGAAWAVAFTGWRLATGRTLPAGAGVNVIGTVALLSSRHAGLVVAAVLGATLVLGYGVTHIDTDVDVADVLPRGDHNSTAAKNLTTTFKSAFTQQVTFMFRVSDGATYEAAARDLPYRQTEREPRNISDEVYIRALWEAQTFVKTYPGSPFEGSVSLPDIYALVNWTLEGGREAPASSFSIPPPTRDGEVRYATVDDIVWRTLAPAALALVSEDRTQAAVVFNVNPQESLSSKEIGQWALFLRDEYVAWAERTPGASKAFTGENAPIIAVDLPVANAHSSELAEKDLKRLIPPIAAFILVALFIAFRNVGSVFVAFTSLSLAVLWTFGAMGYMGIALNTLNLTLVPLLMGVGIDYGIHVVNEFLEQRSKGRSVEEAFAWVGSHAGIALLIGTVTTVGGLLVMIASPSLLIAELGLLAVVGMLSVYFMSLVFMPAAITLTAGNVQAHRYRPSPLMAGLARGVARGRVLVLLVVVLLTFVAVVSAQRIGKEEFGDPPRNWLEDDPLRLEHERALFGYYGTDEVKANVLVFEGDILDPAAHRYMDAIERSLQDPSRDRIFHDRIRTLPFLIRTYLTVRDGGPGVAQYTLVDELLQRDARTFGDLSPYPRTREEMRVVVDEVFASPLYQFGNLFADYPTNRNAIMLVTVRARTFEDAEEVWKQVWSAVEENEHLRPPGMKVSFAGNTATNYLFIAKELPWLTYMAIAATTIVITLVALTTRSLRSTLGVAMLSILTSLWWLAILPSLGIGLAITLTLPLVFIYAIGSDYGLHLSLGIHRTGSIRETFLTTGKAVLFSFVTTFGAFLIYTQISNLAVRRTMIATTLATMVIFVATMLVIPMVWGTRRYLARKVEPKTTVAPADRRVVAVVDEE